MGFFSINLFCLLFPWVYNTNYGQPWLNVRLSQILFQYKNQPYSTIVLCLIVRNIVVISKSFMVKHAHPWSNFLLWQGLSRYENQPCSNVWLWQRLSQYGNQSWSHCDKDCLFILCHIITTMVQHPIMTKIVSIWKWAMANHCPMSHYDKCCINMKINDGQP